MIIPVKALFTESATVNSPFSFDNLDISFDKLATFEERFKHAFKNNIACKDQIRQTLFKYTVLYERNEQNAITLFHYYVANKISLNDIYASIPSIISARFYTLAKLILDSCSMLIPPSGISAQYTLFKDDIPDEILYSLITKGYFNHCQESKMDFDAYDNTDNIFMHLAIKNKQAMIIDLIDFQLSECNQDKGIMNIDLNYKNKAKYNLLHVAIQNGRVELIRKLMIVLPSSSFTEQICNFDSIHYAAFANQEEVLCVLLEFFYNNQLKINSFQPGYSTHGLNVKRCANRKTPLMYAIEHKMIKAIHKIGELFPLSMNTPVAYGEYHHVITPVIVAYAKKDANIFNLLLKYGANSEGIEVKSMTNLDIVDWVYTYAYELLLKGCNTSDIEFKDGKAISSINKSITAKPVEENSEYNERNAKINSNIEKFNREYNWYRRKDFIKMLSDGLFLESAQHKSVTESPYSNSNIERILSIKGIQECILKYI